MGRNDNGVSVRSILISNWDDTSEDTSVLQNSRNPQSGRQEGPYDFIGADSDRRQLPVNGRFRGTRFAFNFFRLGDLANSEQPSSNFQRRIVIVDGSSRELLFSFTPAGTSDIVRSQVTNQRDAMLAAINSVDFAAEEVVEPITILSSNLEGDTFVIEFTNNPGATGFSVMGSADLDGATAPQDFTNLAEVTETGDGFFRAEIELTSLPPRMFFWLTR